MKWMDRLWALLVLAVAAVLGALLCGRIVGAKQVQTVMLLAAMAALLVLAGTLAWVGKEMQDLLRQLKEQEYTSLLPNEEKNKTLPFYPQLWDVGGELKWTWPKRAMPPKNTSDRQRCRPCRARSTRISFTNMLSVSGVKH